MAASTNSTRTSTRVTILSGEAAMAGGGLDKQSSPVLMFGSLEGSDVDATVVVDARACWSEVKAATKSAKALDTLLAEKWGLSWKTVGTEGARLTRRTLAKAKVTESGDDRDRLLVERNCITHGDLRAAHGKAKDANTVVGRGDETPEDGTTNLLRSWEIPGVGLEGGSSMPSVDPLTTGESDAQTTSSTDGDDQAVEGILSSLAISESKPKVKSEPEVEDGGWIFPKSTIVNTLVYNPSIGSSQYRSPNWFDLLQEENTDPFGLLPTEWGFTLPKVPSLPALNLDGEWRDMEMHSHELLGDFSPAYNDQDKALQLKVAVR
jgi:hypothetical protein